MRLDVSGALKQRAWNCAISYKYECNLSRDRHFVRVDRRCKTSELRLLLRRIKYRTALLVWPGLVVFIFTGSFSRPDGLKRSQQNSETRLWRHYSKTALLKATLFLSLDRLLQRTSKYSNQKTVFLKASLFLSLRTGSCLNKYEFYLSKLLHFLCGKVMKVINMVSMRYGKLTWAWYRLWFCSLVQKGKVQVSMVNW